MRGGAAVVVVAAGRGERLGSPTPKQFLDLGGLPLLEWSLRAFRAHPAVADVVAVLPPHVADDPPGWLEEAAGSRGVILVAGGRRRAESVALGVAALSGDPDAILVHDGVRPFPGAGLIGRVAERAASQPVIPVLPMHDTIKRVDDEGSVVETVDRARLRRAQTPQGFPTALLRELHAGRAPAAGLTDDALLCEREGRRVATVEGEALNLKITDPHDLSYARWLVETGVIGRPAWA